MFILAWESHFLDFPVVFCIVLVEEGLCGHHSLHRQAQYTQIGSLIVNKVQNSRVWKTVSYVKSNQMTGSWPLFSIIGRGESGESSFISDGYKSLTEVELIWKKKKELEAVDISFSFSSF